MGVVLSLYFPGELVPTSRSVWPCAVLKFVLTLPQKLLVEFHQHRKVVAFAVALILNCVNSDCIIAPEAEKVAARRVDLVGTGATRC